MKTWDNVFRSRSWGVYPSEAVVREVMSLPAPKYPQAWDLGCGAGANTVFLAERGYKVAAIDSSREALHQAELLCMRRGVHDKVTFTEKDYIGKDKRAIPSHPALILDWLSLAHQPKKVILTQIDTHMRDVVGNSSTYILGLFGERSNKMSFEGVPMPSLFGNKEIVDLGRQLVENWGDAVLSFKYEESFYTRNGKNVQVWCLVFGRA